MPFFKDRILTESIEIKTTPEKIYTFLTGIVDDDSYRAWHKEDHVSFKWLKGQPWAGLEKLSLMEQLKKAYQVLKITCKKKVQT